MINIHRTDSTNPDFLQLVKLLDADLAQRDGSDHSFYAQFNKVDTIRNVVLAYNNDLPVGCGAFKIYQPDTVEIKRMYVMPEYRGKGIAANILNALEKWADECGFTVCILETGKKQPEAISLYQKAAYQPIQNYGQYIGVENSICMKKTIGE